MDMSQSIGRQGNERSRVDMNEGRRGSKRRVSSSTGTVSSVEEERKNSKIERGREVGRREEDRITEE